MDTADIEQVLVSQYIDDANSRPLKLRLHNGSIYYGEFIRKNQLCINSSRNKWILSTAETDILIDGKEIKAICIFSQ